MNHYYEDDNANIEEENIDVNDAPTPLVDHSPPEEIDRSIYDTLNEKNLHLDMKSNHLENGTALLGTLEVCHIRAPKKDSST